jgi:hypothetical protein
MTYDPATEAVTVRLSSPRSLIYQGTIPSALMSGVEGDSVFRFVDKTRGAADGIKKMKILHHKNLWVFSILAYGDLSAATDAEMILSLSIGSQGFTLQRRWERRPWGWYLATDNFGNP